MAAAAQTTPSPVPRLPLALRGSLEHTTQLIPPCLPQAGLCLAPKRLCLACVTLGFPLHCCIQLVLKHHCLCFTFCGVWVRAWHWPPQVLGSRLDQVVADSDGWAHGGQHCAGSWSSGHPAAHLQLRTCMLRPSRQNTGTMQWSGQDQQVRASSQLDTPGVP